MATTVHLREIVQSLGNKDDTKKFYLDGDVREVVVLEQLGDPLPKTSASYIPLPDRSTIDEPQIVMSFCLSLKDSELGQEFLELSQGEDGYNRFKEEIRSYSLDDAWYEFREQMYYAAAAEWCDAHGVSYRE